MKTLTQAMHHLFATHSLKELSKILGIKYHTLASLKSRALTGRLSAERSRTMLLNAGYREEKQFIFKTPK